MRKLALPNISPDDAYMYVRGDDILATRVLDLYGEYQRRAPYLEGITATILLSTAEKEDLKESYSTSGRMGRIRDQIIDQVKSDIPYCPYCNYGPINKTDHYLPKSEYQEYAINPYNLIPSCDECNHDYKGNAVYQNGYRKFVHPYFDLFPDGIFLRCMFYYNEPSIHLNYSIIRSGNNYVDDLLETHFDELGLGHRYGIQALNYLRSDSEDFARQLKEGGRQAVEAEMEKQANRYQRAFGTPNNWQTALYRGMATSQSFFDYLTFLNTK